MQNCGIYPDAISPFNDKPKTDELLTKASEPCSTDTCCAKEPRVVEESTAAFTVAGVEEPDLPIACDDDDEFCSKKRQKVDSPDGSIIAPETTESSILNLLQKHDEGVSILFCI